MVGLDCTNSFGLIGVVDQLQAAAVAKPGCAEQLQVLFVMLCRAHGMLVWSFTSVKLDGGPGMRKRFSPDRGA